MPQPLRKKTLDRALSRLGACSRAQARAWVEAGRVRVDGAVEFDPERWVDPERQRLEIDGQAIEARAPIYLALHKPKGVITSRGDPAGRRTVYELLGELSQWVAPVGRLDRDSSGLLLFTNDSVWADGVTAPAGSIVKRYRVQAAPRVDDAGLERLRAGVTLDDGPTRPAQVRRLRDVGDTTVIEIGITEGRNRQVRRMLRAIGHRVRELKRTSIGPVELGTLPSGHWRLLRAAEVAGLALRRTKPRRR